MFRIRRSLRLVYHGLPTPFLDKPCNGFIRFHHVQARYCQCGGPLRDTIVNFGNTFEHVPSMEDQHDAAWVHCLTLELQKCSALRDIHRLRLGIPDTLSRCVCICSSIIWVSQVMFKNYESYRILQNQICRVTPQVMACLLYPC